MDIQKIGRWASLLSLVMPVLSFAQPSVPIQPLPSPVSNVADLLGKVCTIAGIMFTALLVLAIIFIIIAAFKYLTAGGDAEKVTEANHQILYAAIAVAIGVFARAVPLVVGNFLTPGGAGVVTGVC